MAQKSWDLLVKLMSMDVTLFAQHEALFLELMASLGEFCTLGLSITGGVQRMQGFLPLCLKDGPQHVQASRLGCEDACQELLLVASCLFLPLEWRISLQ